MAQPENYLMAPDFDCAPNTAIRLGHILTSPTSPYESLNTDSLTAPTPSITLTTTKTDFSATRSQLSSGTFGISARILEGACGGWFGHNFGNSKGIESEIDEIETSFIKPAGEERNEYVRSCLDDENVQAFFEGSRFKKSVYMIMGLKIAKGAKVSKGSESRRETMAKVMVDGTAGGVPVKAAPLLEVKGGGDESTEWRSTESFVFAYRLRKLTCKKGKIIGDADYKKGVFLDLESSKVGKSDEELYYLVEDEDFVLEGEAGERIREVESE